MTTRRGFLRGIAALAIAPRLAIAPKRPEAKLDTVYSFWKPIEGRAKFQTINLKMHKLTVQTYVSKDLLVDSHMKLQSYLTRLV